VQVLGQVARHLRLVAALLVILGFHVDDLALAHLVLAVGHLI
jgi:hypothetical protein